MKSVLFVDDEANILQGLKRLLRPMRNEWDMEFAHSGDEAIERAKQKNFHVVVSDMRMPGIDGATLLKKIKEHCPQTIRVILSGQAEEELVLRATQVAHQYISKPCNADELKQRISRAFKIQDLLSHDKVKELTGELISIPSLPEIYRSFVDELEKKDPTIENVCQAVCSDLGLTAKVLQLTNSAFFGQAREISDVKQAVMSIGINSLRELVSSTEVFTPCEWDKDLISLFELTKHSLGVVSVIERVFSTGEFSDEQKSQALTAGLLHEIGRVVLTTILPDEYRKVNTAMKELSLSQSQAEIEVFGCNHPEIGAYLLALWGLPENIVEAIAYHRHPNQLHHQDFNVLSALHVANVIEDELRPRSKFETKATLNEKYLRKIKREATIAGWLNILSLT